MAELEAVPPLVVTFIVWTRARTGEELTGLAVGVYRGKPAVRGYFEGLFAAAPTKLL